MIYEGRIINTPILDKDTIDLDKLTDFAKEECKRAGIDPADIQTGAVIVTGETARKRNARQIAEALSQDAGKFVAASAGPNFESLLAAMGSGATARPKKTEKPYFRATLAAERPIWPYPSTERSSRQAAYRLAAGCWRSDSDGRITRLDEPAQKVMDHIGLNYCIGDRIPDADMKKIASKMADALIEVMTGPAVSLLARQLMVTENLNFTIPIDEVSFSGGVAEFIYGATGNYGDIGEILSDKIIALMPKLNAPVVEPVNKIRATVIGAGAYSLSISGSSGFMDERIKFPLRNIPVLRVDVKRSQLSREHVVSEIRKAFQRFDLTEGRDIAALYFKDPVRVSYPELELFAKSIEAALGKFDSTIPIILIFEKDIACSVGNVIRRETRLKTNLLSLDELILKDGDWIDISRPLVGGQVFPVTVKSLIFNMN